MTFALAHPEGDLFVPDGVPAGEALERTTHLGVGAHQDDLEIAAIHGILECFGRADRWFTGVVVTDGAGSPRAGRFAGIDDEAMKAVRRAEQRKAACLGEYSAALQLAYPSPRVRAAGDVELLADLENVLRATRPEVVYTHDLADRHETHVAVTLRVIEAARRLPLEERPRRLLGCEVWRDLDWLPEGDRVALELPADLAHLEQALLGVFDSQIAGGKRYDLAALGRRRARATFSAHDAPDRASAAVLAMDLTAALYDAEPGALLSRSLDRFVEEVRGRVARLSRSR